MHRKDIDEAMQDLGAAENIVRDFSDANPTMLPRRSLAGVIAHHAADPIRSRALVCGAIGVEADIARSCPPPAGDHSS